MKWSSYEKSTGGFLCVMPIYLLLVQQAVHEGNQVADTYMTLVKLLQQKRMVRIVLMLTMVGKKEKMHLWVKYHCVKWINVVWQPFFMVKVNILWRRFTCVLMFWENCWFKCEVLSFMKSLMVMFIWMEHNHASIEVWWSGWVFLLYSEWPHCWTVRVWWCECVRFFCCCKIIKIC